LVLRRTPAAVAMAVLIAAVAVTGGAPAQAAGNANASANAQVGVGATVLRHMAFRVLTAPRTIDISSADIVLGYVDVPETSTLEIRSNTPGICMLAIESQADFARGTEMRGASGMQTTFVELVFRVVLSQQARPGVHSWPIQVAVLPL
jgi:hypothetical protein